MLTRILWSLSAAWLLSGCATMQHREGLELSLVNIRLAESTVWETTAQFTVRVANGSPEPLVIDGSVHKFYLNGHYVGEGLSAERLEIPRLSTATQGLSVHLSNLSMATRVRSILESQAVDYQVKSTLYLLEGSRSVRCRLGSTGRLAVDDFKPDFAPRKQ